MCLIMCPWLINNSLFVEFSFVMFDTIWLEQIIYYAFLVIILLVSVWLHEYAHAWTSYKLWDPTPVLQWRLTPNPLKHIDVIWLISVFLIWFWWWKPVQINPIYYKNPVRDETLTAFTWPAMNLVLAFFWMLIMMVYGKIIWIWAQDLLLWWDYVVLFRQMFILMNIALAVFNMIPLPPLDGYRLVKIFWKRWAQRMEKNVMWISMALIILIVSGSPIISSYISTVTDIIYRLFFMLFSLIFY
jgi:Zn-dependent protease